MTGDTRPGPRVLLVEDEPANRALVRAILDHASRGRLPGVELAEAGTMAEARSQLSDNTFDIVLLDVRLPDGSGLDLARELRERAAESSPKVVIVSASVLAQERANALAIADEFLAKPFVTYDLIDLLARLSPTS